MRRGRMEDSKKSAAARSSGGAAERVAGAKREVRNSDKKSRMVGTKERRVKTPPTRLRAVAWCYLADGDGAGGQPGRCADEPFDSAGKIASSLVGVAAGDRRWREAGGSEGGGSRGALWAAPLDGDAAIYQHAGLCGAGEQGRV